MQNLRALTAVPEPMNRREMLLRTGAAAVGLGLASWPMTASALSKTRKVLFFTKSSGYEHSVIQRKGNEPSFAEKILADLGPKHGIQFDFSKDGSLFTAKYLGGYDAIAFYTTGDLTTAGTDKNPPMSAEGKTAFLDAIRNGKGFVGIHSATDTFHTKESPGADATAYHNDGNQADSFIQMIGAEFISHAKQQKATMRVADPAFPGIPKSGFELLDEWYSCKNISKDLHVLLVQQTKGMDGKPYQRPPYPATWARAYGRGRVFYTSLGHREDVWTNPLFEQILFGGIAWATRNLDADVAADVSTVTPGYSELPPK